MLTKLENLKIIFLFPSVTVKLDQNRKRNSIRGNLDKEKSNRRTVILFHVSQGYVEDLGIYINIDWVMKTTNKTKRINKMIDTERIIYLIIRNRVSICEIFKVYISKKNK